MHKLKWVHLVRDDGGECYWTVVIRQRALVFWDRDNGSLLEKCGDCSSERLKMSAPILRAWPWMPSGQGVLCGLILLKDLHRSALDVTGGPGSWASCTPSAGKLFSKFAWKVFSSFAVLCGLKILSWLTLIGTVKSSHSTTTIAIFIALMGTITTAATALALTTSTVAASTSTAR